MVLVTVLLGALCFVLLILIFTYAGGEKDERRRAEAAALDADWWKFWAKEREREADTWRKKALDLEEQARVAERKQLWEAFETIARSEAKALTVESASNAILRLYDEACEPKAASGAYLFPGSPIQYMANMLALGANRTSRDYMKHLVDFLADKARKAEATEQKQAG